MTREELMRAQEEGAPSALVCLVMDCRWRFLRAAHLVGLRGRVIEDLARFGVAEGVSIAPLLPAWAVLCERYLAEQYSPQLPLLPEMPDAAALWWRFLYSEVFPGLLEDDEFVRNVLYALGALPYGNPRAAASALRQHLQSMELPGRGSLCDVERQSDS